QKMKHVPYALRRSVLEEIERELPLEVAETAEHQFRHPRDLSIPSSLHHYWSFMTGRSVPGGIGYAYINLSRLRTPFLLSKLLRHRDVDVFCVNDTDQAKLPFRDQYEIVKDFFEAYFPFRAPFEVDVDVERERQVYTPTELGRKL